MVYLLCDIVYCAAVAWLARTALAGNMPFVAVHSVYAVSLGTVLTVFRVLGHDCGHGAFAKSSSVNEFVWILLVPYSSYLLGSYFSYFSTLLVPYFPWKFYHAR